MHIRQFPTAARWPVLLPQGWAKGAQKVFHHLVPGVHRWGGGPRQARRAGGRVRHRAGQLQEGDNEADEARGCAINSQIKKTKERKKNSLKAGSISKLLVHELLGQFG